MKYLLLILLIGCGTTRSLIGDEEPVKTTCPKCDSEYQQQLMGCMLKFAGKGYDSQAVINICEAAFERRN